MINKLQNHHLGLCWQTLDSKMFCLAQEHNWTSNATRQLKLLALSSM